MSFIFSKNRKQKQKENSNDEDNDDNNHKQKKLRKQNGESVFFVCLEKPLACWIISIFLLEFPHDETCALNCESFNLLEEDHREARYQFVDDSRTDLRSRSGSLGEEKILLQRHTVLDRQMVSKTQANHQVLQNTSIECVYCSSVSGRNALLPVQLCPAISKCTRQSFDNNEFSCGIFIDSKKAFSY